MGGLSFSNFEGSFDDLTMMGMIQGSHERQWMQLKHPRCLRNKKDVETFDDMRVAEEEAIWLSIVLPP